ncbi:hypothetical protein ACIP1G_27160 [Pseudomonas sp. NPDC089392]|uniref:hypothetical protein n=1 Tax=Pseudomonas sp. NPDC089392 TaxID=3364459 RepID=UPI003821D1D6
MISAGAPISMIPASYFLKVLFAEFEHIDTPYVTVGEYAKRSGQSDSAIRREIELGRYLIRPKVEGSKSAVNRG